MTYSKKSHFWPILFILLLFSICIFIIGIQYGKSVANTDAAISYIKSIRPTKNLAPTIQTDIGYIKYVSNQCGLEFTIPSSMKVKENDTSVYFTDENYFINLFCSSQLDESINLDIKSSTVEVDLKEASHSAKLGNFVKNNTDDVLLFNIIHPTTKKSITIITSQEYQDLITGSIKFINPQ